MKEKAIEEFLNVCKKVDSLESDDTLQFLAAKYGLSPNNNHEQYLKTNTLRKFFETDPQIAGRRTDEVFREYVDFCLENNMMAIRHRRGFSRAINELLGFTTHLVQKNGSRYTVFQDLRAPKKTVYNQELCDQIYNFAQSGYFEKFTGSKYFDGYVTFYVYDIYKSWCKENNLESTNLISFVRVLCDISAYKVKDKRVEGIIRRVFYLNS